MKQRWLHALWGALGYLALGCGVTFERPLHSR
jgi:hypothetical protein